MKKFFFSFFLNILVLSLVFSIFEGVILPSDSLYFIGCYVALSFGIMLQKPILKFLTVKNNVLTYWISASVLTLGVFYLLLTFVPGIKIIESVVKEMQFGAIKIVSFKLDTMLTMTFSVLLASLISGIMETLKKPVEE